MEATVAKGLQLVRENIKATYARLPLKPQCEPRLVAISKTKPKELVIAAYKEGQRHFGENYVNELVEKSNDPEILSSCPEIQWHFIGHLQRNKVPKVIQTKRLFMVETVDSDRLATALDNAWRKALKDAAESERLKVMVQVNTSNEEEKSGVKPEDAPELAKHIVDNCPGLNLVGLMTIGRYGYDYKTLGPNPDFQVLVKCRSEVAEYLKLPVEDLELSMGMSDDYEHAIELGSTNVRVGSSIFGHRERKAEAV